MKEQLFSREKIKSLVKIFVLGLMLASIQVFVFEPSFAQTNKQKSSAKKPTNPNLPKVTQIDLIALKNLLKREGENSKPLLVNFWATWCDPCREEFPDLVKIDSEYKGKIDFITISLDDLAEIDLEVPKFLGSMKATMPAYLLKTANEEEAIGAVYKDWQGGLPFTILFSEKGEIAYSRQGKIKLDVLRTELDKFSSTVKPGQITQLQITDLPLIIDTRYTFENGKTDARKDIADGKLIIRRYGLTPGISSESLKKLKEKYGVEYVEHGCFVTGGLIDYVRGYNETSTAEIRRKFGTRASEIVGQE